MPLPFPVCPSHGPVPHPLFPSSTSTRARFWRPSSAASPAGLPTICPARAPPVFRQSPTAFLAVSPPPSRTVEPHRRSCAAPPTACPSPAPAVESVEPTVTPTASRSSSSSSTASSASSSSSRSSRRWGFIKDLLKRSKSDGSKNNQHHHPVALAPPPSFATPKRSATATATRGRGTGRGRRRLAHERLYEARRAEAEEMRRRTLLPYRQGLLLFGCIRLGNRAYDAAVHGLTRGLNTSPAVSTRS